MTDSPNDNLSRRDVLGAAMRGIGAACAGTFIGGFAARSQARETVWQIDPRLCTSCGKCATECILRTSAVKCVHGFSICGFCDICSGYFPQMISDFDDKVAENQICPVAAIKRVHNDKAPAEGFEYRIDENLCVGCARCSRGCNQYGNGSLYMQVRHNICVNCNQCRIAIQCPAQAFKRVSAAQPYIPKQREQVE